MARVVCAPRAPRTIPSTPQSALRSDMLLEYPGSCLQCQGALLCNGHHPCRNCKRPILAAGDYSLSKIPRKNGKEKRE